ncbi:unnamed protein product [Moneuplotes crassus]|uniref:Uncharacterized protein n=1 Tax=Euplotes crassus TaxID=5936 RepID=A0AAD1UA57_EUPCR|nr:unnamed protein product [Moneuplotes crassus]
MDTKEELSGSLKGESEGEECEEQEVLDIKNSKIKQEDEYLNSRWFRKSLEARLEVIVKCRKSILEHQRNNKDFYQIEEYKWLDFTMKNMTNLIIEKFNFAYKKKMFENFRYLLSEIEFIEDTLMKNKLFCKIAECKNWEGMFKKLKCNAENNRLAILKPSHYKKNRQDHLKESKKHKIEEPQDLQQSVIAFSQEEESSKKEFRSTKFCRLMTWKCAIFYSFFLILVLAYKYLDGYQVYYGRKLIISSNPIDFVEEIDDLRSKLSNCEVQNSQYEYKFIILEGIFETHDSKLKIAYESKCDQSKQLEITKTIELSEFCQRIISITTEANADKRKALRKVNSNLMKEINYKDYWIESLLKDKNKAYSIAALTKIFTMSLILLILFD